jgi:hypothetical protein
MLNWANNERRSKDFFMGWGFKGFLIEVRPFFNPSPVFFLRMQPGFIKRPF